MRDALKYLAESLEQLALGLYLGIPLVGLTVGSYNEHDFMFQSKGVMNESLVSDESENEPPRIDTDQELAYIYKQAAPSLEIVYAMFGDEVEANFSTPSPPLPPSNVEAIISP